MKRLLYYLTLIAIVIGAGALSGVVVMQIATRDKGDIPVPNIEGEEIVAALEKVTDAGLHLKITELTYDKNAPRNTVISQDPKAATGLKRGREVRVVISRGSQDVIMPDLRNVSLRQAKNILSERSFAIPTVTNISSDFEEGSVIAQLPPAGSRVIDLSRTELLVSLGSKKEPFLIPDFTGLTLEEVADKVRKAELKLGRVRYVRREEGLSGTVLEQEPPPGKPVKPGLEVSLTVKREETGDASPRTFTIYNFTLPPGAGSSVIRIITENMDGEKEVYNRPRRGGDVVSLLVEIAGDTSVRVYVDDELAEVKRF